MTKRLFPSVVDYAFDIVLMHQRIQELEAEVEHLKSFRDMYFELLDQTNKHTNKLFGVALAGALGDIETAKKIAKS